jgi:hypothetical protein
MGCAPNEVAKPARPLIGLVCRDRILALNCAEDRPGGVIRGAEEGEAFDCDALRLCGSTEAMQGLAQAFFSAA